MRLPASTVLMAAMLGVSGPALAQTNYARVLPDSRTVTLPTALPGCQAPQENAANTQALLLRFTCSAPEAGWTQIVVITRPMTQTPREALEAQAAKWWPDFATWPAEQKAAMLTRQTKTFSGGAQAPFLCLHRDNVAALNGDAACILDTPTMQVVIEAQSSMASTADDLIDAVLAATTVR